MAPKLQAVPQTDTSVMNPDVEMVTLGNKQFPLRELPLARLKRFKGTFIELFNQVNTLLARGELSNENLLRTLFGMVEDAPGELLDVVIIGFDPSVIDDEENGVTLPQLKYVMDRAISINGLDVLRRALPFLESLALPSVKLSMINRLTGSLTDDATEKTTSPAS